MEHCFRLVRGQDLKKEILLYCKNNKIEAGVILCAVGCIKHLHIRLAEAKEYIDREECYEIVSITGTLSKDDCHIHISVSDNKGNTIGGHLKDGTIVDTTCEVVIYELDDYIFNRELDNNTGYEEIVMERRS
ncbi:MAG TPA: DUF296 domain-containing protein [Firmicutes bacterium]|nr:DUF296 domain-containing protein [Bacillota bacterium]